MERQKVVALIPAVFVVLSGCWEARTVLDDGGVDGDGDGDGTVDGAVEDTSSGIDSGCACADGPFFSRVFDGIVCYDLRKP